MSGGAIEPAVRAATAAFEKESRHPVRITFNTAPQIQKRVEGGDLFDIVIALPAIIDGLVKAGAVNAGGPSVGRVGLGAAVREGAPVLDSGTTDALKKSVRTRTRSSSTAHRPGSTSKRAYPVVTDTHRR